MLVQYNSKTYRVLDSDLINSKRLKIQTLHEPLTIKSSDVQMFMLEPEEMKTLLKTLETSKKSDKTSSKQKNTKDQEEAIE